MIIEKMLDIPLYPYRIDFSAAKVAHIYLPQSDIEEAWKEIKKLKKSDKDLLAIELPNNSSIVVEAIYAASDISGIQNPFKTPPKVMRNDRGTIKVEDYNLKEELKKAPKKREVTVSKSAKKRKK